MSPTSSNGPAPHAVEVTVEDVAPGGSWLVVAATEERALELGRRAVPSIGVATEPIPRWLATAGYRDPTWRPKVLSCPRTTPVLFELSSAGVSDALEALRWLTGWEAPVLVVGEPTKRRPNARGSDVRVGSHAAPLTVTIGAERCPAWFWAPHGGGSRRTRERARDLVARCAGEAGPHPDDRLVHVAPTEPVLFARGLSRGPAASEVGRRPGGEVGRASHLIVDRAGTSDREVAEHVARAGLWGLATRLEGDDQGWRRHLAPSFLAVLDGALSRPAPSDVRERTSVRLRRAAHRHHALRPPARSVSVLLATRRWQEVPAALDRVLAQHHRPLELVVAAHGEECRDRVAELLDGRDVGDVVVRSCWASEEETLGDLLNRATERATGDVVVKMDDDDWYAPEHVDDLLQAMERTGARLVGKAAEFFYLGGLDQTIRRHEQGAETWTSLVAGATLAIERVDLLDLGGWAPVRRAVDQRLLDAARRQGEMPYRTHGFGFVVNRHGVGQTWLVDDRHFVAANRSQWPGLARREAMLDG